MKIHLNLEKDFILNYNKVTDEEVDVQYTEKLHDLYKDQPFLLEIMKIENAKHIWNFKKAWNHQLVMEKVNTLTTFNQKV